MRADHHVVLAPLRFAAVAAALLAIVPQATATTIYGVSGDPTNALPAWVFAIDPDAHTITSIGSALPGVGATLAPSPASPTELFVSIVDVTNPTTPTTTLYSVPLSAGAPLSPIVSPAPVVSLGDGHDGLLYATGSGPSGCCFPGTTLDLFSAVPGSAFALIGAGAEAYLGDVAADAGGTLYGVVASHNLVTVSKTSGVQTVVGDTGLPLVGLAFSLDGRLWGATSTDLYQIAPTSGVATHVMTLPAPGGAPVNDLASEPSATISTPTPTQDLELDHFKCYPASMRTPGPFVLHNLRLEDQFESKNTRLTAMQVMLCNPVDKNGEGIEHPDEHLVCYLISDETTQVGPLTPTPTPQPTFAPHRVAVANQFGAAILGVKKPKWLCVPSSKTDLGPVSPVCGSAIAPVCAGGCLSGGTCQCLCPGPSGICPSPDCVACSNGSCPVSSPVCGCM